MKSLWHKKILSPLEDIPDLNNKLNTIADYLAIKNIQCKIPDLTGFKVPPPLQKKFKVEDILGPRTSYTKRQMGDIIDVLSNDIDSFTYGDSNYDEIETTLKRLRSRCEALALENDPYNELYYKGEFNFYVLHKNRIKPIPTHHLILPNFVYEELRKHLILRFNFYNTLLRKIDNALIEHLSVPHNKISAYTWGSKNPELEVTELVSTLEYIVKRIGYNKDAGGSFPKFRKAFFGLFGLSDNDYSNKIEQIKKRKKGKDFIIEMAKQYEEYYNKLRKPKKK